MKYLLVSTALVVPAAVLAQDVSTTFRSVADPMEIHASEFIGKRVYAVEAAIDADAYEGVQTDWQDIGEINDVILSRSGEIDAVLVDIGGFLGMGERQVAVDMGAIRFVADSATPDDESDYFLVMNANRAAFEEAPEYSWSMPATTETTTTAETTVAPTDAEASAEVALREGYVSTAAEDLTAEMLTGAAVYDGTDTWIGEVSEIVLTDEGRVNSTVIDVGGFLGIGEKPVELGLGDISIQRQDGGDEVRVFTALTKEQLEAMPTYQN
jgi:sporulation protein YlmC with PRC-barrel domain